MPITLDPNNFSVAPLNQPVNQPNSAVATFSGSSALNVNQQIDQNINQLSQTNSLQYPLELPKFYTEIRISTYTRASLLDVGKLSTKQKIYLPVPLQINDTHTIVYEQKALGVTAGTAIQAGSKISGLVGVAAGIPAGILGQAGQYIKNVTGAGVGVNAAEAIYGYAPNDFFTILLRGPEYKRHKLTYMFSPNNRTESDRLKQIIDIINNAAAPSLHLAGALFGFPDIFEIGFQPNSNMLFKFKPAVVESINFNYSAGGVPGFYKSSDPKAAAPEAISVDITFLELEYWLKGDFKDSTDAFSAARAVDPSIYEIIRNNIQNPNLPVDANTPFQNPAGDLTP